MKIVYLNPLGQLGGAERVLLDLMAALQTVVPDFSPHLIVGSVGPLAEKAIALNIPVTVNPYPTAIARLGDSAVNNPAGNLLNKVLLLFKLAKASISIVPYVWRLRRLLIRIAPEIIHTNGFKMHLLGLWARPGKTPVIWHIHDYVSSRPLMAQLIKRSSKYCAAIITNSNSVADDVRMVCGDAVPIHTIYNAIDLDYFCPTGMQLDLDALAGLPPAPPETIRVALLSTMARWKGQEVFLRALASLTALPIRGYIIGGALYQTDGSQYSVAELRQVSLDLGLNERVGFTGFIDDAAAAIRACDVVVHASTQPEPFGLVIVEAIACGRPVIVSLAGGAAELVEEEISCLGHRPGDAITLSDCIRRLAQDESLRQRLGQAGHVRATEGFDRTRLAQKIIPIYQGIRN